MVQSKKRSITLKKLLVILVVAKAAKAAENNRAGVRSSLSVPQNSSENKVLIHSCSKEGAVRASEAVGDQNVQPVAA